MNPFELIPIALAGAATAALSWAMVATLVRLAPRIGLVDLPNERSLHTRATPRGGGIGFILALALSLVGLSVLGVISKNAGGRDSWLPLASYSGAVLLIALVSLRDDFRSLGAGSRLVCQILAAGIALLGIGSFRYFSIPGCPTADFGWFGAGLTVFWIVGLTNVYNFMDGIDGIAGIQGVVAGLAWAAAGLLQGSPEIAALGISLAGGCLGFLGHNWSPARIFMGDVGSAFLGYSFAVLPLLLLRELPASAPVGSQGSIPVFALLVVWPFVGDGLLTFFRRARNREKLWRPHRSHLYQRLVQAGWTHARVSALYGAWSAASCACALIWLVGAPCAGMVAAVFPLASLGGMLALTLIQEERFAQSHA